MNIYRILTDLANPAIRLYLRRRLASGREDGARFDERSGIASRPRPAGKLVWCHAASVGETMSVLSLLRALRDEHTQWNVLLTTGTVTSARMVETRLPAGVIHQYVPVDLWPYATRFLNHWKPDLALWVESELWPNLLTALRQRRIPAVLLNGRISEKSFRRWSLARGWIASLLGAFTLGLAQTEAERARFAALGLRDTRCVGNLKYAAAPLPCDELELSRMKAEIGTRKVWLMASTHRGEDEIALEVHRKLRRRWPDILTMIVPRHAKRGDEVARLISAQGLRCFRRSRYDAITPETEIYLADTMGELGLFYRLSPIVGLAGSFAWGGHNPIEAAQLGCAAVFGPRMTNFAEIAAELIRKRAAIQARTPDEFSAAIERLLDAPDDAASLAAAALDVATSKGDVLKNTLRILEPFFTENPK